MKQVDNKKVVDSMVKPMTVASTCRCASLCQGGGVNCKGCQDQNADVTPVKDVYKSVK